MGYSSAQQSRGQTNEACARSEFYRVVDREQQDHRPEVCATYDKMADADQHCGGRATTVRSTSTPFGPHHSGSASNSGAKSERTTPSRSLTRTQCQQRANFNMETHDGARSGHSAARKPVAMPTWTIGLLIFKQHFFNRQEDSRITIKRNLWLFKRASSASLDI